MNIIKTPMKMKVMRQWLKPLSWFQLLLLSVVMTVGMLEMSSQKALSQQAPFSCGQLNGQWHTFKRKLRQNSYPFITWQTLGLGLLPRDRCIEVTNRFNDFYSRGILGSLVAGYYNNLPVICVGWCNRDRILFTLPKHCDPAEVLSQLMSIINLGFTSGRIFNTDQVSIDSQTGNYYFLQPNGETVPLFVQTSGEAEMNFQYLICALDPEDPSCP